MSTENQLQYARAYYTIASLTIHSFQMSLGMPALLSSRWRIYCNQTLIGNRVLCTRGTRRFLPVELAPRLLDMRETRKHTREKPINCIFALAPANVEVPFACSSRSRVVTSQYNRAGKTREFAVECKRKWILLRNA